MKDQNLLEIKNLKTYFFVEGMEIPAVDDVSYEVKRGKTLGVVGESGSGKSVTAFSIMRLIPEPPGKIIDGQILFKDKDIVKLSESKMRDIRGNHIAMIFQEPMTSLNPVYTIGFQIVEAIVTHQDVDYMQAKEIAIQTLKEVGIPIPEKRFDEYPHQLSGGMRQRVMIAMALSCKPSLLIADEPTTALDVTIQAQILDLLRKLQKEKNMSIIMITHDLGVIAEIADDIVVMYAGKVVERGTADDIFNKPNHPYTKGLLKSIPKLYEEVDRLYDIKGMVPHPSEFPKGCRFNPRCEYCMDICQKELPPFKKLSETQYSACWLNK